MAGRPFPILVLFVATMSAVAVALALPTSHVLARTSTASVEAGSPGSQNDAGSGQDAGDTLELALLIPNAHRTWSANLTPTGTDSDWYRVAAGSAFCAVASATPQSPGSVALTGGSLSDAVRRPADAHQTTRLVLAAPGGDIPRFGMLPPSVMLMASEEGNGPPTPGRYTFSFTTQSYADLDPEADGESPEAGATPATSEPLPAECTAGRLAASDTADRYHFDVADARDTTFSFAIASGGDAQARIVAPDGTTFATLASGDVVDVWADTPGRWSVVVERPVTAPAFLTIGLAGNLAQESLDSDYLLGFSDGPDPEACRPACVD